MACHGLVKYCITYVGIIEVCPVGVCGRARDARADLVAHRAVAARLVRAVVVGQLAPPRAFAALADADRVGAARIREERKREEDVEERVRELEPHRAAGHSWSIRREPE